jgi:hypothetical protein
MIASRSVGKSVETAPLCRVTTMPHIDNCRSGMLSLDTSSSGMTRGDILRYRIAFALMPTRKIVTELKEGT